MAAPAPDLQFERIYRLHARDVYRFALAVVRNPTEAEDVTQTTFLNAYRALQRGEAPERPRSWLFAIAHNAIRSRHRWTLRRPKEVPLEHAAHRLAVPADEQVNVTAVLKALGELPPNQREALAMRELEGLSYGEIAETLGVSVAAVESLISRGRRTLRLQRAKLRSLVVLQLPRSLRTVFQQAGSGGGGGLAAKAASVVAAATAVAGGVGVVTHPSHASEAAGPEAARALALVPVRTHARTHARAHAAPRAPAAPAQLPGSPQRGRVPRTDDASGGGGGGAAATAPSAPGEPGAAAPQSSAAQAAGAAAASAPAPAASAATGTVAQTVAQTVATTTAALPDAVSTPSAAVPSVTVGSVTVPSVPVPSVTVPVPDLPAPPVPKPQGTPPLGIK